MIHVNFVDLSIIILSYNSKTDLERLLPSIFESEGVRFDSNDKNNSNGKLKAEVTVVDNNSKDATVKWLETVFLGREKLSLIKNTNNGFSHGNNLGIKAAKGKYLLILNPDTKLEKDTLKTMYEFMESNPEVGISTCKVVLPNGKLDLACRRRFPNPWNSFLRLVGISKRDYNMLDTNENASQEIDSCMGAFMMVRRTVLERVDLAKSSTLSVTRRVTSPPEGEKYIEKAFDETFFMYGEDLDLCWRVKEAGFKVWYYPKTFITHYKGSSSKKTPFKALKWFHDAMWIFYKKHYAKKYIFIFNWLVFLGIYLRFIILVVINSFKKEPKVSG
jgi:GT2 family glycosyltransferase